MPIELKDLTAVGAPSYGTGSKACLNGDGMKHVPGPLLGAYCQGSDYPPTGCRASTALYSYWIDGLVHGGYLYLLYGGGGGLGNGIIRYTLTVTGDQVTAAFDSFVAIGDILAGANTWITEGAVQYDGTYVILVGDNSTVGTGRTPVVGKWAMTSWPFTAVNATWLSAAALSTSSYVAGQITSTGSQTDSPLTYLGATYLYVISARAGQIHCINPATGAVAGVWVWSGVFNSTEVYQFQLWGESGGKVYGGNVHANAGAGDLCRWSIANPAAWAKEAEIFEAGYYNYPNPVKNAKRAARSLDGRSCTMRPISRYQLDLLVLPATTVAWWESDYANYGQADMGTYDTASGDHRYVSVPQDPNRRAVGNSQTLYYPGGSLRKFAMIDGVLWYLNMSESSLEHESEAPGIASYYQRGMLATPLGPASITYTVPSGNGTPKALYLKLPAAATDYSHACDWTKYRARIRKDAGAWSDWRSGPKQLTNLDAVIDGLAAWPTWTSAEVVEVELSLCSGWPYSWGGVVSGTPGLAGDITTPQISSAHPGPPRDFRMILAVDASLPDEGKTLYPGPVAGEAIATAPLAGRAYV